MEDNPVNQHLAVRLIEKQDHSADAVSYGLAALAVLEKERFDLVLMDVQMPEMDGFETSRAIRQREQQTGAHLPIIAMTAHAMQGDRERCLAAGMDAYVTKPVSVKELFAAIESVRQLDPLALLAFASGLAHSYLSATSGSTFDARRAGT